MSSFVFMGMIHRPFDLGVVRTERLKLQGELKDLEVEMEGYLQELGYGA